MSDSYGYVRVSTKEQHSDRQIAALHEAGLDDRYIYIDRQSGKSFDRPQYLKMLKKIKRDDVLYIKSIDRLGRDYNEILLQWRTLTKEKGIDIIVLDMPLLDTRRGKDLMGTFISDIVLQILSFVSENERTNIHERQAEGIAAAKARGVVFGRPKKLHPEQIYELIKKIESKEATVNEISSAYRVSKSTLYRCIREYKSNNTEIRHISCEDVPKISL